MLKSRSYWSFIRHAQGRHNLHSPFVFDLVNNGMTTRLPADFSSKRKKWLSELAKVKDAFDIVDLGAGSHTMNNRRTVRQLARASSSRGLYGNLLFSLSHHFKPATILELGTSLGIGTLHLQTGSPGSLLTTVEGCDETLRRAVRNFTNWQLERVITVQSSFDAFLQIPSSFSYDMVFLDGHHNGKATLAYMELLKNSTHNETIFILDDIRWSEDMWQAWQNIVNDPCYHVTIDFGRMGIAVRREQQMKEHFIIRPKIFRFKLV